MAYLLPPDSSDVCIAQTMVHNIGMLDKLVFSSDPLDVVLYETEQDIPAKFESVQKHVVGNFGFSRKRSVFKQGRNDLENMVYRFLRIRGDHLGFCYTIILPGCANYFRAVQAHIKKGAEFENRGLWFNDEDHLCAIAAHEVRHRIQYYCPEIELFAPWNVGKFPVLHKFAFFLLTNRELYSEDFRFNVREFDALIIERLVVEVIQHDAGIYPERLASILLASPEISTM